MEYNSREVGKVGMIMAVKPGEEKRDTKPKKQEDWFMTYPLLTK